MRQEEVIDIRITRSKKAISDALVELIEEKDFKTITITDIVNQAGVNRGTFYKHYAYKEDILKEIQDDCLEKFAVMLKNNYQEVCYSNLKTFPLSDAIFTFTYAHRNYFHFAVHHAGFLNFHLQFSAVLKEFLIAKFFPTARYSLESQNLLGAYIANGIYGYLVEWDEKNYTSSPAEMAQQLTNIFLLDRSIVSLPVPELSADKETVEETH
ncbi:transcriptional regulator, TetR family [Carnobacterium alterfunditum]|uniref:Transcriptional regulator, TetR family n=1 Tax=Carnobacterium alterfunditum TaxID=28230 RepID=A0A1N6HL64_9LACT|nr:TetR/AcrR family transcriptional regulator [Carnobacterium alterfunditum]SIO20385.1 transcriptional regulator, TetR family [Carnobacterium alterfunditum]